MMDEFIITISMVLGIIMRIGIPIGITFLLAHFLRRLDSKWRDEASQAQPGESISRDLWLNNPCWGDMDCVEEQRKQCAAYNQTEKPCWEVFRENGSMDSKCWECEYRKELLLPVRINIETNRRSA
jgi:hypothetical protein